ncbi:MAG: NfeD family protein [Acidobacteriota bacterium]
MPEGLVTIVCLLALGFILLFLEIFVPGGVLGILGALAMVYGCYLAFDMSPMWGTAAVTLSVVLAVVAVRLVVRSRIGKKLVLNDAGARDWKAAEEGLEALLGREGVTLSTLRPAGLAEIDEERIDVVADSEFLEAGVQVRVCEVEGNRVVVEAIEALAAPDDPAETEASAAAVAPAETGAGDVERDSLEEKG